MAKRHDLNIVITNNGKVEIEVKGVDGPLCVDITKDLEEELGVVINREKTSEYYKETNETGIKINKQES
jgi:hypothetical protein